MVGYLVALYESLRPKDKVFRPLNTFGIIIISLVVTFSLAYSIIGLI